MRQQQRLIIGLLLGAVVGLWMLVGVQAEAIERPELNTALLATVRLAVPIDNAVDRYSTGSGTIFTSDGLILSNYHVVADTETGRLYNRQGLVFVAVNPPDLRGEALWTYRARVIKSSQALDLVVLRIVGLTDEKASLPKKLALTAVPVGSSNDLLIGDELNLFGFPGIGQGSVTFTRGIVAGFVDEDGDGVLDWIKTDADVARGNSGGLATNAQGQMVGIPSAGVADVETASSISLLRPIDRALSLMRAAQGQSANEIDRDTANSINAQTPRITSVSFTAAIDHNGDAVDSAQRFDYGIRAVYAVFRYENFSNSGTFRFVWRREGQELAGSQWQWQGGNQGRDWVNMYAAQPLEVGAYELELQWNGSTLYTGQLWIGETPAPTNAQFGAIVFATAMDENELPVDPNVVFSNVNELFAFFDVIDMKPGTHWSRRWYIDNELVLETEDVWQDTRATTWWVRIKADDGLPAGTYRLELNIEDRLSQQAEVRISESQWREGAQPVQVIGTVVDANRRSRKIAGATVFVLQPGITVSSFLAQPDQAMIYAYGISDQRGNYQLNARLTPGESYGIAVYHEAYQMVTAEAFTIDAGATSPWRIDVKMRRK